MFTIMVPLLLVAAVIVMYSFNKYRKKPRFNEVPTTDHSIGWSPPTPYVGLKPLQLVEVKAQGRFGAVWKALDGIDSVVAVKIFPPQDRYSWVLEQEVFRLPQMRHNNVLTYLGAEIRGEGINSEYWLVTEYHSFGSLWDHLKVIYIVIIQIQIQISSNCSNSS